MLQKAPESRSCPSWTEQEVQELRSSLLTSDIAAVDTEMFGKRFSEIIGRVRNSNKRSRVNRASLSYHGQVNGLLGRDDWDEDSAADLTKAA
jgi:hypothetical protein